MSITADQIDLWRSSASETQNLEFKEAKNQYDTRKLCRYCVAIANEGGGHLVLGVADKPPRAVVGSEAFADTQDIAEKLFQWLGFRVDVEVVAHPDGRVVVFIIPGRPRGTAYHYDGAYLMRSGEEHGADERRPVAPHFCRGPARLAGIPGAQGCVGAGCGAVAGYADFF